MFIIFQIVIYFLIFWENRLCLGNKKNWATYDVNLNLNKKVEIQINQFSAISSFCRRNKILFLDNTIGQHKPVAKIYI